MPAVNFTVIYYYIFYQHNTNTLPLFSIIFMSEILLLCEYPTLHGGEHSMLSTLPGIRAAGFKPVVVCPGEGFLADSLRAQEVEIISFSTFAIDGQKRPPHQLREELARL